MYKKLLQFSDKVLIGSLLILLNSSCHKDECCVHVLAELKDDNGVDLLDLESPDNIVESDIAIYYEINGKLETYASLSPSDAYANPSGFDLITESLINGETQNYLQIFSNPTQGISSTIIRIKDREDIRYETEVDNNRIRKIWYEGNLVWPVKDNDGPKYLKVILN